MANRTETDYRKQSVYRALVEPHKGRLKWWSLRRVDGWRYVIERCWSVRWSHFSGARASDWSVYSYGRTVHTPDEATRQADAWLDAVAERRNSRRYIKEVNRG